MWSKLDIRDKTVFSALGEYVYKIPEFQRPFCWKKGQIQALLQDLFEPREMALPHFFGTVVLEETAQGDYRVVDGQQRLICFSLVVRALISVLQEHQGLSPLVHRLRDLVYMESGDLNILSTVPKLHLLGPDATVYGRLLADPPVAEGQHPLNVAWGVIRKYIGARAPSDLAATGFPTLVNRLKSAALIIIFVPSARHAYQVFETLNDRGSALNGVDLIKHKLLWLAEDEHRQKISEHLSNIERMIPRAELERFFVYHYIALHGGKITKFALKDAYPKLLAEIPAGALIKFASDLEYQAQLYAELILLSPNTSILSLTKVETAALASLKGWKFTVERPLLLLLANCCRKLLAEIAVKLEWFLYRRKVLKLNPNKLTGLIAGICEAIRQSQSMEPAVLRKIIVGRMRPEWPADKEFKAAFADLCYTRNKEATLVLSRLVATETSGEIIPGPACQLEHILPRSARKGLLESHKISPAKYKDLVRSIGNLAVVLDKLNAKMSNKNFADKQPYYAQSFIPSTEYLATIRKDFTPAGVKIRASHLASLAVRTWRSVE